MLSLLLSSISSSLVTMIPSLSSRSFSLSSIDSSLLTSDCCFAIISSLIFSAFSTLNTSVSLMDSISFLSSSSFCLVSIKASRCSSISVFTVFNCFASSEISLFLELMLSSRSLSCFSRSSSSRSFSESLSALSSNSFFCCLSLPMKPSISDRNPSSSANFIPPRVLRM